MPVYEITEFRAGISSEDNRGRSGVFRFGTGLNIRKERDSLSCNQAIIDDDPTNVVTDLIGVFVNNSVNGTVFGFGGTGCIYERSPDDTPGTWVKLYTDPDGAICGACEFYTNDGKNWIYYATETKLKRWELTGGSFNSGSIQVVATNLDDSPSANDVGNFFTTHPIRMVNNELLIGNMSKVALVGRDSSYTPEALQIQPRDFVTALLERNTRGVFATINTKTGLGVNAIVDTEITLAQIGNDGNIFNSSLATAVPLKRLPGGGSVNAEAAINGINQGAVYEWDTNALAYNDRKSVSGIALFGTSGADVGKAGIYSYGRDNQDHPFALNLEYAITGSIGALCFADGASTLIASYSNGSDKGVKVTDFRTKGVGTYEGLVLRASSKKIDEVSVWSIVEIFCDPLPAGASIQLQYKLDKTGSFINALTADGQSSYNVTNGEKAVFQIGEDAEYFEPRVILNPIANLSPEVFRIKVFVQ